MPACLWNFFVQKLLNIFSSLKRTKSFSLASAAPEASWERPSVINNQRNSRWNWTLSFCCSVHSRQFANITSHAQKCREPFAFFDHNSSDVDVIGWEHRFQYKVECVIHPHLNSIKQNIPRRIPDVLRINLRLFELFRPFMCWTTRTDVLALTSQNPTGSPHWIF